MQSTTIQQHWDALHTQPRFRPRYPNEHVVRFLMANFAPEERAQARMLDIGVGGGRHMRLLCELGFQVVGTDISEEGLIQTERLLRAADLSAELRQAEMTALPFAAETFDGAISFCVFTYANSTGMAQAVAELHRILRLGGRAFLMLRSDRDYRCGKGEEIEPGTYRLTIEDTNEFGLVQRFLREDDIPRLFSAFQDVRFELTETTFDERRKWNSDWLITVKK